MSFDPRFTARNLYDVYAVTIRFRDRLTGGMPKNRELIQTWVEARTGFDDEITKTQVKEELDLIVNDVAEKSWMGFAEDQTKGLFIFARNVKAMFKQGASMLRTTVQKPGSKQIFAEGSEIKGLDEGDRLYLGKMKPDGMEESPIHVMTAKGPRTALKRVDYVEKIDLSFNIWVLRTNANEKRHVGEEELIKILTFSQENGLGADRSQGQGKFDVVKFERVT